MQSGISRRSVLAAAGCAAVGSAVGSLLSVARAQEAAQARQGQAGGICLSMVFEDGTKVKFDTETYVNNHLPLLREVYGDSVERIEGMVGPERDPKALIISVPMFAGIPVPCAVTTLWIRDVASFGQRLAANADRINKDLDTVSHGNRLVQPNRVVLELGEARSQITTDTQVVSNFYRQHVAYKGTNVNVPAPAPGSVPPFDTRLFVEGYLPRIFSLYGPDAVRRLEATVGMDQGGKAAVQIAAFHMFIGDRDAFDAKTQDVFQQVKEETAKLNPSAARVLGQMRVKGVA
jgi:hypothetical protein